jgi:acetylornithine deacetylase/succinyl-diaminopimelate desuccinylase-like protein
VKSHSFAAAALAALLLLPASARAAPAPAPVSGDAPFRAMLKEMIETDTSIASGDCTALVTKIVARMTAAGFPAGDLHVFIPDGNPKAGNLVAVLPGRDPKAKAVLMLGHIDVVNARREDWVRDPFTLIEENGQLYGRGVSDMKAQDAIWADNMVRYHNEGYRPARTIKMALTCGEEAASFLNGAGWLAQNQRELIDAGVAITEGGGGILDAQGKRLAVTVMAAEKGGGNVVLEVTGPGGHSSLPRPENAIITLSQALARTKDLEYPTELNDFSRAYLTALAPRVDPETGAAMRKVLTDPQDPAAIAVLNRSVAWHAMLRTTCIPTLIEGGHAPNAQPQRARATINCRTLPGSPMAPVVAAITRAVNDPQVKITAITAGPARSAGPPLTPLIMGPIEAAAAKVFPGVPVTPMQETFGTDSGRLIAVGIPTYGFSGLFRGDDAGNIHGLNEHLSVASLMDGREMLYRLIKAYAEQK